MFRYLQGIVGLPEDLSGLRILEVGCAAGGILKTFAEKGADTMGLDLIIYFDVLEHILFPNEELQLVRRHLRVGGMLYIALPGVKNLTHSYNNDFLQLLQNAHTYHFSLRTLQRLLANHEFCLLHGN